jgi:tetratricopeptide (TPR) repeat protein
MRVMVRVVKAPDRATVWGGVFDDTIATTTDLFGLYSRIAQRVVEELDVVMSQSDWTRGSAVPTRSLDAYHDYLRGREYHGRTPNAANHLAAIKVLERAVRRDSSFALAYAWLSIVETNAHWLAGLDRSHLDRGRVAATRALTLDSALADAHTAMAHNLYACCADYERALWHLTQSIAIRPGDWQSVMFKGNVYKRKGMWPEAIAQYQEAVRLNPLFRWPLDNLGHAQLWSRDYDGAERTFLRVLEHEPQDVFAHAHLALLRVLRGGDTRHARRGLADAEPVIDAANDMRMPYYLDLVDRRYDEALTTLTPPVPSLTIASRATR